MDDQSLQNDRVLNEAEGAPVAEPDTLTIIKEPQVGGSRSPKQEQAASSHEKPVSERLEELVARDEQFRSKIDPERVKRA